MFFKCKICTNSFDISNSYGAKGCYCKNCHKIKRKQHYLKNKEQTKNKVKEYRDNHKEIYAARARNWCKNNKKRHTKITTAYAKRRLKTNIQFKLTVSLRSRLKKFLKVKNFKKKLKFSQYIGCSPEELKKYIESKFYANMSWSNHGIYFHIDHIIPLASAQSEEEIYKLCHYTNLQPLTIEDHKIKTIQDLSYIKNKKG
jgi:hypothetical protein